MKKGKAGVEKEVVKETTCNDEIEKYFPVPTEFDYFTIWEPDQIKGFLIGQKGWSLREGFLIDMQRVFTMLKTKIDDLENQIKEISNK